MLTEGIHIIDTKRFTKKNNETFYWHFYKSRNICVHTEAYGLQLRLHAL